MQGEQTSREPIEQSLARTHSNCHYQWLLEEKLNMMRLGFTTKKQNQNLVFWVGKVSEAIKNGPIPRDELDICLRPLGSPLPSLAIVSGWTEAYGKMLSDARHWIRSGNGGVRKVFLLRWSKTPLHEVGCDLEVYEWDKSTRTERLSQEEVVLPEKEDRDELQVVTVLFSEIFGRKFPDTDPNSSYIFSLGRLRAIAKKVIEEDGYGLRTVTVASDRKAAEEVALARADNSILQELLVSQFPPSSQLPGQGNQLQPQIPPAAVGTRDFGQKISSLEQAPSAPAVDNSNLPVDPISTGTGEPSDNRKILASSALPVLGVDNPKNGGDVSLRNDTGSGLGSPPDSDLDAPQPLTSPSNTATGTGIPSEAPQKGNNSPPEVGSSENKTCSLGGSRATPAEVESVKEIDPGPGGSGDPDFPTLILQTENPENQSDNSSSSGAHVPERPAVDVCVTMLDEPNAQITPENTHQEPDVTKDILDKRESESIADSPGETGPPLRDPEPTHASPVSGPEFHNEGNGDDTDSEPLGRVGASLEHAGATVGVDSVLNFDAAPGISGKWSPPFSPSQDSDLSDISYTSDISDISDTKVDKDTDILGETDPIIDPRVGSESLEEANPSLEIDTLETLRDKDAVGGTVPIDGSKSCSEPPEKNIGCLESPPPRSQGSGLLEAATCIDSGALEAVGGSGSIEKLDSSSHPNTDLESSEGVNPLQVQSADIGEPKVLGSGENTDEARGPETCYKPSEEASSVLNSPQPSGVPEIAAGSAEEVGKTGIDQAGPDSLEEIILTTAPSLDSITPVAESAQAELLALASEATDDATGGGVSFPGGIVSPKLPPSFVAQNTSQDGALEGGSVLTDVENFEVADTEVVEEIFLDTEEEFRAPGAQQREETGGSASENLPTVEPQAGGVFLPDSLGLTRSNDRSISSSDSAGVPNSTEGLESAPRIPSALGITMSPGKGDSGEFFDTRSDAPGNNPDSVEVPGDMGSEGGITLSKPPDTPHSCQVGSLRGTEISTPRQPTAAKIDGGFGRGGIAGEKEGSTNPQSHVEARGSDVGSQKGTQRVDETESQKVEIGPAGFCTATASPPTPQYDQRAPECPTCRQAAAPSGTPKSLEEEGNLQSKPKSRLVTALSSYVSSLWGKPASQKPPTAPSQASIPEVHEATDTVLTPQEPARAIKSSNPRRSRSLDERKVSWDDIVKGKKLERSESPSSFAGSSPDQQSLPPVTAGGNSIASGGPYAGDPLGIGIQLGDNVYSLMSTEVHCEHSASGGRVIKAEANSLTRASPASEYYYEESPFADIRDEAVQIAAASYCGQVSDEVEDRESLAASRPKAWVVNRPIVPSPMRSPFRANFFPWSDAQGIPLFGPSSVRKEAPTPAIGPLGERSNTGSPMVGRTPRVGAESPCLSGHASCVHTSNTARPSPTLTTAESPNPTAFGNTRLHRGSPAGRTHPVSGRLVPPHGPPGASVRGMQSGRYQSVIQEEREEFSHSFMDESGLISPERFSQLEVLIRKFAVEHFSQLPMSLRMFESSASLDRSPFPPEFLCTSSLGKRLRIAAVQNIICRHLVNNIFSAVVPSFCFNMEAIAGELLKLDPSKQALWQRLTVEALEALPQHETAAAKLRQKTVNKILASIGAISASPAATLAESLQELVKSAQEAWEPTFKSKAQTIPEVDVENGTANFKMDPEDSRVRGYSVLQVENITRPVLCTFPAIHQIADGHGTLVVPGRALFSDFYHSAEMELQAKLKTWKSDQRYAHRASFMRPPFVHRNTRSPTSPESQSGRWGTGRMSHEYFGYNQWCSHLNDVEDETVDLWDVSMRLKEYDQEVLRHERRRSTGSETFSERRSSYIGRSRSFSNGRRESVYSRRESVYERRVPVGGRRESFYGGRRESFQGSRDYCRW